MRWPLLFTLILWGERDVESTIVLDKRENQNTTTTATSHDASATASTTTGTQVTATEAKSSTASTTTDSATSTSASSHTSLTNAATTVPSLNGVGSLSASSQNNTQSTYTGGLPIKPEVTPALGVGGFILLVLGAALALIGIRKQWANGREAHDKQGLYLSLHGLLCGIGCHSESSTLELQMHYKLTSETPY
ncbi:uncharacterized protein N7477_007760 [Penicillium maclennaniae]|uniref:uncharacterized protein n=1 Tax=Penicillium maclennaniae TaxID=1343394 RepID=UPI00253F7D11|nr:uncharacterized protein N7477_007760 [Penicillium maclennaniae]KAJ5665312.1 hypothetical protein N7477_007760 [Penicillium maclennaniae]